MAKLTEKQKLFIDEYLVDLNATRAYRSVYKNVKNDETAASASARMLRNVKVAEYVNQRMKDREKRTEITQDKVLSELAAIAFANGSDFAKVVMKKGRNQQGEEIEYQDVELELTDNLPVDKKKAIASIKMGKNGVEIATCDKVKALELLGRHLGMFKDKLEVSGLEKEVSKLDNILMQMRGDPSE
ncbi:phage terminase small subunit [Anaerosporobacter mobilis DSM 15930]|jgi:phage terminase small subunit|uniref:Phage terminase small subunit n=1 Tax=Anaerosporobacter mobilis DSM 15930 TaxID=1120996 RepID=A0A1M7MX16_9FIRM|nr:terminase small subunit [Anaerosporobacter mobilis]SHM95710.1 phage terminase small subunit [Anaerosporobacter mobilis DSM 15930]